MPAGACHRAFDPVAGMTRVAAGVFIAGRAATARWGEGGARGTLRVLAAAIDPCPQPGQSSATAVGIIRSNG